MSNVEFDLNAGSVSVLRPGKPPQDGPAGAAEMVVEMQPDGKSEKVFIRKEADPAKLYWARITLFLVVSTVVLFAIGLWNLPFSISLTLHEFAQMVRENAVFLWVYLLLLSLKISFLTTMTGASRQVIITTSVCFSLAYISLVNLGAPIFARTILKSVWRYLSQSVLTIVSAFLRMWLIVCGYLTGLDLPSLNSIGLALSICAMVMTIYFSVRWANVSLFQLLGITPLTNSSAGEYQGMTLTSAPPSLDSQRDSSSRENSNTSLVTNQIAPLSGQMEIQKMEESSASMSTSETNLTDSGKTQSGVMQISSTSGSSSDQLAMTLRREPSESQLSACTDVGRSWSSEDVMSFDLKRDSLSNAPGMKLEAVLGLTRKLPSSDKVASSLQLMVVLKPGQKLLIEGEQDLPLKAESGTPDIDTSTLLSSSMSSSIDGVVEEKIPLDSVQSSSNCEKRPSDISQQSRGPFSRRNLGWANLVAVGETVVMIMPTHVIAAMGDFDMDQIVAYRCKTVSKTTFLVEFQKETLIKLLSVISKFEASYNDLSFLNITKLHGGAKLYDSLKSSGLVAVKLAAKHRTTAMLYTADAGTLVVHSAQVQLERDERVSGTAYNAQALHNGDTAPGDSGAPLYDGDYIVGFHTGYRDSKHRNVVRMFPLAPEMEYGYEQIPEHGGFAVTYGSDEQLPRHEYDEENYGDRERSIKDYRAFGTSDEERQFNPNYSKKQNKHINAVESSLRIDDMIDGRVKKDLTLLETEEINKKRSAEKGRAIWADVLDEKDTEESIKLKVDKAARHLENMLSDRLESFTMTQDGIVQAMKKVVQPLQQGYEELVKKYEATMGAPNQSKVTEEEYVAKVQDFSSSLPDQSVIDPVQQVPPVTHGAEREVAMLREEVEKLRSLVDTLMSGSLNEKKLKESGKNKNSKSSDNVSQKSMILPIPVQPQPSSLQPSVINQNSVKPVKKKLSEWSITKEVREKYENSLSPGDLELYRMDPSEDLLFRMAGVPKVGHVWAHQHWPLAL